MLETQRVVTLDGQVGAFAGVSSSECAGLVLDGQANVQSSSLAWHRLEQGYLSGEQGLARGQNLPALLRAVGHPVAREVAEHIDQLIHGSIKDFVVGYTRDMACTTRHFVVRGSRSDCDIHLGLIDTTVAQLNAALLRIQVEVGRQMAQRRSLGDVAYHLACAICAEFGWHYTALWQLERKSWALRCVGSWRQEGFVEANIDVSNATAILAPGVGLPGRAWASRRAQSATDEDIDPALSLQNGCSHKILPPSARHSRARSGFAFPIKWDDDVLIVLEFLSTALRAPPPQLVEFLDNMSTQIALSELRERAELRAEALLEELSQAKDELQSIFDCTPGMITVINGEGRIQCVGGSDAGSREKSEAVRGQPWEANFPLPWQAALRPAWQKVLASQSPEICETMHIDDDGVTQWYSNYLGPIRSERGCLGVVVVSQSITASKLAQTEVANSQKMASLGTLAAGVAHEINTPIQFIGDSVYFVRESVTAIFEAIKNMSELHRELKLDGRHDKLLHTKLAQVDKIVCDADLDFLQENVPTALDRGLEGLNRVATIVQSLKEFSHPASSDMMESDLNRAIQCTLTIAGREYKPVADLTTDFGDVPPVVCHVGEINQVVLNLVINAAHAIAEKHGKTGQRGHIAVSTRREGNVAVITVQDDGVGIADEIRGRIFDPFFTTKPVGKGTGQGLALAWAVVHEHHGGEIDVDSQAGVGSRFIVKLPILGPCQALAA